MAATEAHCAYCFETLAAKLEGRKSLSFTQVLDLWKQYTTDPSDEEDGNANPADTDDATVDTDADADAAEYGRPAAISRLMAHTPSSTSSSSVQSSALSTPSRGSEASSASSAPSLKSDSNSNATNPSAASGSGSGGGGGAGVSYSSALMNKLLSPGKQQRLSAGAAEEKYPLFVTYNTVQSDGEKRLRGCIGTFEPYELDEGLRSYALTSALDDSRFPPITALELPTLECSITLLHDFEPIADALDWTVGTHGLRISFVYHGRRLSATFLPNVAPEQGWSKEETLVHLMRKGGWGGRRDEWSKVPLTVVRYQGSKAGLGWEGYKGWREWVEREEAEA